MWRPYDDGLLQHRFNVGPGFGVPLGHPAPVPPRSGQRGSAPTAQHGPEPGRRVPTGAARYERKPQCGEISHIHLNMCIGCAVVTRLCLRRNTLHNNIYIFFFTSIGPHTPSYGAPIHAASQSHICG